MKRESSGREWQHVTIKTEAKGFASQEKVKRKVLAELRPVESQLARMCKRGDLSQAQELAKDKIRHLSADVELTKLGALETPFSYPAFSLDADKTEAGTGRTSLEIEQTTSDKSEFARLIREIGKVSRKSDENPVATDRPPSIPAGSRPPVNTTIINGPVSIYKGPVFHGDVINSQLAWDINGPVSQNQTCERITPGFEAALRLPPEKTNLWKGWDA
ncbi:hypothetical protein [Streptomyces sp. NPDC057199]|uniref:hypothetical protein n=1 Tax=Streptomyces sp. NPDC057199 TaxID=3346047 RepID=UPI00362E4071